MAAAIEFDFGILSWLLFLTIARRQGGSSLGMGVKYEKGDVIFYLQLAFTL